MNVNSRTKTTLYKIYIQEKLTNNIQDVFEK